MTKKEQLSTQPGRESNMKDQPDAIKATYKGSGKLKGKVALITGGDSGIGRAVAVLFAREGADVAINYLNEDKDAQETKLLVEAEGGRCLLLRGDISDERTAGKLVEQTVKKFGRLHILVNNAAEQHVKEDPKDISAKQLQRTFQTNVFGGFYVTQAALEYLKKGSAIINTASVVAFKGHPVLIDYAATKGAVIAFTKSLAQSVAKKGIRVNAVAPGPIWTPLIPSTFPPKKVKDFGKNTLLGRPGQPEELAPAYVFLASDDSSYMVGQTIHVNGGDVLS